MKQYMLTDEPRLMVVQLVQGGLGKAGGREYTARLPKGSNVRIIGLMGDTAATYLISSMGMERYEAVSPARTPAGQYFPRFQGLVNAYIGVARNHPVGWGGRVNLPWYDGEDFHVTIGTYSAVDVIAPVNGLKLWAVCVADPAMKPEAKQDWTNYPHYFLVGDADTMTGQRIVEGEVDSRNGYSSLVQRMFVDRPANTVSATQKGYLCRIEGYGGVILRENWMDQRMPAGALACLDLDEHATGWDEWLKVPDRGGVRLNINRTSEESFGVNFLARLVAA